MNRMAFSFQKNSQLSPLAGSGPGEFNPAKTKRRPAIRGQSKPLILIAFRLMHGMMRKAS